MVDVIEISAIVTATGVLVGIVYYILEMRNQTKTRQMGLIMSIYSLFTTTEYVDAWEKMRTREFKDFDEYVKKYGLKEFLQVASVWEGLGFLLHRKFLDVDTVRELLSESTKMSWEKVKPMVENARKQIGQRETGEYVPVLQWWEYLYNELQKREQQLQAKKG
jgi:hypothetical protein